MSVVDLKPPCVAVLSGCPPADVSCSRTSLCDLHARRVCFASKTSKCDVATGGRVCFFAIPLVVVVPRTVLPWKTVASYKQAPTVLQQHRIDLQQ